MSKNTNALPQSRPMDDTTSAPRVVLYARVSIEEQAKADYPSCETQIESLREMAAKQGWLVVAELCDEGYSAGSLLRPALSRLRSMVAEGEVDVVAATYIDRLTRSRDFFELDKEFKDNRVRFTTMFDPTDPTTASGRFMEIMLVAAKTYEREQTGEKVSTKARQRAEKGLYVGGSIPFGFYEDEATKVMLPDPDKKDMLVRMFQVYVESRSDFAVRDWLKAHQIPTRKGKAEWAVGTIRDLLTNRRYIGEIEINSRSKGRDVGNDHLAYRVVIAPHPPVVPLELFEMAQQIRAEKALESPNRTGRPRHYSRNKDGRV